MDNENWHPYLKNKSGTGWYLGWAACRSISILWLTDELAQLPNFHCGYTDVPSLYYLSYGKKSRLKLTL